MANIKWAPGELEILKDSSLNHQQVAKAVSRSLIAVYRKRYKMGIIRKRSNHCNKCGVERNTSTTWVISRPTKDKKRVYFFHLCRKCANANRRPRDKKKDAACALKRYHAVLKHDLKYKQRRRELRLKRRAEYPLLKARYTKAANAWKKRNIEKVRESSRKSTRKAVSQIAIRYVKQLLKGQGFKLDSWDAQQASPLVEALREHLKFKRLLKQIKHEKAKKHE